MEREREQELEQENEDETLGFIDDKTTKRERVQNEQKRTIERSI